MSSKKRIAILYSENISAAALGSTRTLLDLANMLNIYYDIRLFSLGKTTKIAEFNNFIEETFKSTASSDSRNNKMRILDYLYLIIFGKQYSYYIMNKNKALQKAVHDYKPDIIITLGRNLIDTVIKLNKISPKTITISITDDFRVVENSIKIRRENLIKKNKGPLRGIKLFFFDIIRKRHINFSLFIYQKMLKQLTATAFVTEIDRQFSIKRYPNLEKKFFVLPTASFPEDKILKKPVYNTNKDVTNILFIGNCKHEPNLEAMKLIESEIAPKLKDKHFTIIGSGCEKRTINNVEYTGFISEEEKNERIDNADICIAPLLNGSGIKVKILDYFARCRPVIGSNVAFEGYPISNMKNAIIENNISNYAKRILELESNPNLRERLSSNASEVCAYFSYSHIANSWLKVLTALDKRKQL